MTSDDGRQGVRVHVAGSATFRSTSSAKSCSLRSASHTYAQPTANRNGKAATPSSSHGSATPNGRTPADRRRDREQQRQPAEPDRDDHREPQRERRAGRAPAPGRAPHRPGSAPPARRGPAAPRRRGRRRPSTTRTRVGRAVRPDLASAGAAMPGSPRRRRPAPAKPCRGSARIWQSPGSRRVAPLGRRRRAVPAAGVELVPVVRRRPRRSPGDGLQRAAARPARAAGRAPAPRRRTARRGTRRRASGSRSYRSTLRSAISRSGLSTASPSSIATPAPTTARGSQPPFSRPAQPAAGDEHQQEDQPEPQLAGRDQQPQPGEAVRVLVDLHPVQRRGDDDQREHGERPEHGPQRPAGRRRSRGAPRGRRPRSPQGQHGDGEELPEAAAGVLGVGQPGGAQHVVVAAEQAVNCTATNAANSTSSSTIGQQPLEPPHGAPGAGRHPVARRRRGWPGTPHRPRPSRTPRTGSTAADDAGVVDVRHGPAEQLGERRVGAGEQRAEHEQQGQADAASP